MNVSSDFQHLLLCHRIQIGRRFVEDQDRRALENDAR